MSYPTTFFAEARRVSHAEFVRELELLHHNPLMDGLLTIAPGLLAVLNDHRQVLAVNPVMLNYLGLEASDDLLGLRPGEIIKCIHAHKEPNGCGTTEMCSSCGAAVAIVTCLAKNEPVERLCALTVKKDGHEESKCLSVRCVPIQLEGRRLLVLFLEDISRYQEWAALQEVFLHDINNVVTGLMGASEFLKDSTDPDEITELSGELNALAHRLTQEIAIHRAMISSPLSQVRPRVVPVKVGAAMAELRRAFANHPSAQGKNLLVHGADDELALRTDYALLLRVLTNMLKNAYEASSWGEDVKVWIANSGGMVQFSVWNRCAIPESIQRRIFQRYFTTKAGPGRGLGTYGMKKLGEDVLGGTVSFTSDANKGTIFQLALPVNGPGPPLEA